MEVTRLLCIDPGKKAIGFAYSDADRLIACGCIRSKSTDPAIVAAAFYDALVTSIPGFRPDILVAEAMVWRPNDRKSQPNDLLDVTRTTMHVAVALRVAGVRDVEALEWKGNLPKAIHHARLDLALTEDERAIVRLGLASTIETHAKEVLDAVGIWAYYTKRTDRAGRSLRT